MLTRTLTRTSSQSLTHQLCERFAERIRSRLLAPGARLPSVRLCAQQQGVSVSTVVAAYDQLQALGLVVARQNSGFYVRDNAVSASKLTPAQTNIAGSAIENTVPETLFVRAKATSADATQLIRGMFHRPLTHTNGATDKPQPGMGVFPPDWLVSSFLPAAVRKFTSAKALADWSLNYGEPKGDISLRRALSHKLGTINMAVSSDQIITTVGATHALDLVSRTLLQAGDCVMVEEPGWAVEFARLSALGMQILPVPRHADGPDLAVMERYCQSHAPKLFVSVSVLHNPTGASISPGSAHRVLQLAQQHNFHIVEDDTYSHLAPEHATRLCALDGLQRTIYVSGFAKILAPGWRVGFLAAPPDLVERLLDTKLLATLTTPALLEKALAHCIDQGQLRRHAERIRVRLGQARARCVQLALSHGCTFAAEPAGLFGWVDTGVDTDTLAQRMLDEGFLIAPGSLFHAVRHPSTLMRINFATTQDAAFWAVFARLRGGA